MRRNVFLAMLVGICFLFSFQVQPCMAQPTISCGLTPIEGKLSNKFKYKVSATGSEKLIIKSELLLLDTQGEIVEALPIWYGDIIHCQLDDQITVNKMVNGVKWQVFAPGILIRAEAREQYESRCAFCSPFANVRLDTPEKQVFSSSPNAPDAPVSLVFAVTQMKPSSIAIRIDCVDILKAINQNFPGGPYSGSFILDDKKILIKDLNSDFNQGLISFTLFGLPGGAHEIEISGTPYYSYEMPPWNTIRDMPLGILNHSAYIFVFKSKITSPQYGENIQQEPIIVEGSITHGRRLSSLRINGKRINIPEAKLVPDNSCFGKVYEVNFSATIPKADLLADFENGNEEPTALDPGVNYLSVIAADSFGNTSTDRIRISVGNVLTVNSDVGIKSNTELNRMNRSISHVNPHSNFDGYVKNGIAASISEHALNQRARAIILPRIVPEMINFLESLKGNTIESVVNPCADASITKSSVAQDSSYLKNMNNRVMTDPPKPIFNLPDLSIFRADNNAPELQPIGNQEVVRTKLLTIRLSVFDQDGDDLTYHVQNAPANSLFNDNVFEFGPDCDQLGVYYVTFYVSDGELTDEETIEIKVIDGNVEIPFGVSVSDIIYNRQAMNFKVELENQNEAKATFNTGPIIFEMHASKCVLNCLFCCCLDFDVDFSINLSDIELSAPITLEQMYSGINQDNPIRFTTDLKGLVVSPPKTKMGGLFAWNPITGPLVQALNLFRIPDIIMTGILLFGGNYYIEEELEDLLNSELPSFGKSIAGLNEVQFDTELPGDIPLTMSTAASNDPVIVPNKSISVGLYTDFNPKTANDPDPEPPWIETYSRYATADMIDADLVLQVSDDALNQMMSALTATQLFRKQIDGLTISDMAGSMSPILLKKLSLFGISASSPIILTLDLAQDQQRNAIPPIIGFIDDPTTKEVIEMMTRTQLVVRGILARGKTFYDDRDLCPCSVLKLDCLGNPCILFETVLKLNIFTDCSLVSQSLDSTYINFTFKDIHIVNRKEGFSSYEMVDLSTEEDEIVQASADSPLGSLLKESLNQYIPSLHIPRKALTVGGYLSPINLRLFARTIDNAGIGLQDYFGIYADIKTEEVKYDLPVFIAAKAVQHNESSDSVFVSITAIDTTSRISNDKTFEFLGCYPNPFNTTTNIEFLLKKSDLVEISIYNINGREIDTIVSEHLNPGIHKYSWNGGHEPSGVYFYRIKAKDFVANYRMVMIK